MINVLNIHDEGFFSAKIFVLCFVIGCDFPKPNDDTQPSPIEISAKTPAELASHPATLQPILEASPGESSLKPSGSLNRLKAEREQLDQNVWSEEVAAQAYEQYFVSLWDKLRVAEQPLDVLAHVLFDHLSFPMPTHTENLELGIRRFQFSDQLQNVTPDGWQEIGAKLKQQQFRLLESEWHHATFQRTSEGAHSVVGFVLHLARPLTGTLEEDAPQQRIIVRGNLDVKWREGQQDPQPADLTVRDLEILARTGRPVFRRVLTYRRRPDQHASAHPIIVYDLDGNGFPEILISRWNRVYWNQGAGRFKEASLFKHFVPLAESGVVADLTADGRADFAAVDKQGRLVIYVGNSKGEFNEEPVVDSVIYAPEAAAITAGDVDGDRDLDLWVTQYKPGYRQGQMPTPYYDANDGEPSFLLLNDGRGHFTDATQSAGLAAKRRRRTYSTSLFDWDDDGDQDLLVVSDYAGVDLHENQGDGHFVDITEKVLPERHLFGMAHTLADFDRDGLTDIYAIGMSSTTARRLDQLGLGREDRPDIHRMRGAMGYGNRMYLRRQNDFASPSFAAQVARTGWSWGTTSFDFDLDGDRDVYVANGFRSGQSCQDYCTTYWRHDIYTGSSDESKPLQSFFADSLRDLDQGQISWNGFEHNRLLLSIDGQKYTDIAFLLGVSFEYDARSVVGADLDSDGRPDLVVAQYDFVGQGFETTLHAYQNTLQTDAHWIGVDLHHHAEGCSPIGAKVVVHTPDGEQTGRVVTGDSFLAQHPARLHFGLGETSQVDLVEIFWPDGTVDRHRDWSVDRYHRALPGK